MSAESMHDFLAEEGDWPPERIAPFVRFVMRESRRSFVGLRVTRTVNGCHVVADREPAVFAGAWAVGLAGPTSVRIAPGTVNGRVPWLDGRDLEGLDETGAEHPGGVPLLDVSDGPGERRRSYVGLVVRISAASGAMDAADREALSVAHRQALHAAFLDGGAPDEELSGFWPLAMLHWDEDGERVARVRQWAYFDYTHRYQPGEGGRRGRHWFRPA